MVWVLLGTAIASEVMATLALRASRGFTVLLPSVLVVLGYGLAFVLLAQTLKHIGVGTAYATWSGLGTVGAAVGGMLLFGERLTVWGVLGIALVVAGVALLNLAGGASHA